LEKYFAAANSKNGFVSWFDSIFDPAKLDRTYIIKGGSGTGKSTLMKRAAERAEKNGAVCEYFLCSSDPTSIDGVIMNLKDGRRLAMLDGTAPHTTDPKYPGVLDEIVNLGKYWCADLLTMEKDTAVSLADRKKRLYANAYADLSVCGELRGFLVKEAYDMLLPDKLEAAMLRLLTKRIREKRIIPEKPIERIRGLSAISCEGVVHLTGFDACESVMCAVDVANSAPLMFDALIAAARKLSLSFDRAPDVLMPEFTEAVRFPELSLAVVTATERSDAKPINMARFLDREKLLTSDRRRRRSIERAISDIRESALSKLADVKRLHRSLEAVYIRAMDFTLLEEASERLYTRMGV